MVVANIPNVDAVFGAPFIGLVISCLLSGVVAIQVYLYYRTYPQDSIVVKSLVAFIWLLDLAHLITITYYIYYHAITHWGDVSVFNHLTWSWGVQLVFNTTIMFTCQAFLTYRLMIISEGNWWITSVAALMSLVQFVSGMVAACSGLVDHISLETVASLLYKSSGSIWLISGAVDDALLALALSYYLYKRSGMKNGIVDRLILYISSTGALTSVVAFVDIVTYLAMPHSFVHLSLNFPLGRIYTNSLLSSLNLRQALRNSEMISTLSGFNVDIQRSTVTTVDDETETRGKGSKIPINPSKVTLPEECERR